MLDLLVGCEDEAGVPCCLTERYGAGGAGAAFADDVGRVCAASIFGVLGVTGA